MFIKCWLSVSLTALAMASCMAVQPVAAEEQSPAGAYCSNAGNLAIAAMQHRDTVPLDAALGHAATLFDGDDLFQANTALQAGYAAKPAAVGRDVGQAVFDNCMEQVRLTKV